MINIKGKNALITGSSRGVGQQIALGLAALGCNIIVHGRTLCNCKETLDLLKKYPVKVHAVYGELSEKSEIDNIIHQIRNLNIPVDILYNNAAIMRPYKEDIFTHTWDDWQETFKVNVTAMYVLCAAFIPDMEENGFGRVINTTSDIDAVPELAPYGASKWAVDKLTYDLASKYHNTPVRINTFNPSWLQTDMGGADANNPVEAVLPGALGPVLIDDNGPNGRRFEALKPNKDFPLDSR